MHVDLDDTIVAIASAAGGAARAVVRFSGPAAASALASCFRPVGLANPLPTTGPARRIAGSMQIDAPGRDAGVGVPVDLLWWPTSRSYTRQQAGELHLPGSPPLVEAVVDALCSAGARPARPGEFTLRAFLAGRLDLTQAEAVLGVIDARGGGDLDAALAQLAGGLSRPLHQLRDDLLAMLAELEAGLDFADEDIEFIAADQLQRRLAAARETVAATRAQLNLRDNSAASPRAVLTGAPNAGKSSLLNALAQRYGIESVRVPALVSDRAGTTRDYLVVRLGIDGVVVELIDTAGEDDAPADSIARSAQRAAGAQRGAAEIELACREAAGAPPSKGGAGRGILDDDYPQSGPARRLTLLTKSDLLPPGQVATVRAASPAAILVSSVTGAGVDAVAFAVRGALAELQPEVGRYAVAATAARAAESLRQAEAALEQACNLASQTMTEDLVAAEVRAALHAVGEVVGAVYVDDVLDRIFSQFCIGK